MVLCRVEQFSLLTQQCIVAILGDSVFRTEMGDLESQEEDVPKLFLWYKPMDFLGGDQVSSPDVNKIRDNRAHYNNRPSVSISFMPVVGITSVRLHCEFVRINLRSVSS